MVDNAEPQRARGEIVGIAGLMGAGRTEFAMSLFGRSYGTASRARCSRHGKEIKTRTVSEAIENGIAYATEDRKHYGLNLIEDIKRNISMAALGKLAKGGWVDNERGDRGRQRVPQEHEHQGAVGAAVTGKLSGGNQQKVVLSKWIYSDPDVLILDEPTRGIDVGAKYEIYTIINEARRGGQGDHRDLLRAARAARHLRPHLHPVCRAHHRRGPDRRRHQQETLMHYMTKEKD